MVPASSKNIMLKGLKGHGWEFFWKKNNSMNWIKLVPGILVNCSFSQKSSGIFVAIAHFGILWATGWQNDLCLKWQVHEIIQ